MAVRRPIGASWLPGALLVVCGISILNIGLSMWNENTLSSPESHWLRRQFVPSRLSGDETDFSDSTGNTTPFPVINLEEEANQGVRYPELWENKQEILRILQSVRFRLNSLQNKTVMQLPEDKLLQDLYGTDIRTLNFDKHCPRYRQQVPLERRVVGVAGMFNSGTNLLNRVAKANLRIEGQPEASLDQVPWGKHWDPHYRNKHVALRTGNHSHEDILPVVIIRDPYQFLQSLCDHPYTATWRHMPFHCPNLVANADDKQHFKNLKSMFGIRLRMDNDVTEYYNSTVHLWNEWYNKWFAPDIDFPFVFIRYEDLLLKPRAVMTRLADCVGGTLQEPFVFRKNSAKSHGSRTDFIHALIKTGDIAHRYRNMTDDDLRFMDQYVDRRLVEIFSYKLA